MNALRPPQLLPLLFLAVCLGLAGLRVVQVRQANDRIVASHLDAEADRIARSAERTLQRFELGLRGARGVAIGAGGERLDHQLFQQYAASRDHTQEFPGSLGIGFARQVERADEAAYLAQMRLDRPEFRVSEFVPNGGARVVVEAIEPLAENAALLGLDLASSLALRATLASAAQSGRATLSPPAAAPAGTPARSGFLLTLPIYRHDARGNPVAEPTSVFGWVFAPLDLEPMLASAPWFDGSLSLRLSDITDAADAPAFHATAEFSPTDSTRALAQRTLTAFERRWRMDVQTTPAFVRALNLHSPERDAAVIMLAGALIALLLQSYLDRRQRQRQRSFEQARVAAIIEGADSAIIGSQLSGEVISWNPAAERLFGYPRARALGQPLNTLIQVPEQADEDADVRRRVAEGLSVTRQAASLRRADRSRIDVEIIESPIRDAEGEVIGISATVRDVTRQLAVENTFRELMHLTSPYVGAAFLDRSVEALCGLLRADLVFITRAMTTGPGRLQVLAASQAGVPMAPWEFDVAGTPCQMLYDEAERARRPAYCVDGSVVVQSGVSRAFPCEFARTFEGFVGLPLSNREGVLLGHVAALFMRPIGDDQCQHLVEVGRLFAHRMEAELLRLEIEAERDRALAEMQGLNANLESEVAERTEEIRRVSALQRAILANAGYALIAGDAEGRITAFNRAAERMLGYSAEEVIGQTAERFHLPAEVEARARALSAEYGRDIQPGPECFFLRAADNRPDEQEWTYVRKDGRHVPVVLNVSALRNGQGQIEGYIGVAMELTERKQLEQALITERDRFRSIFDVAPSAILTVDAAGRIESANARAEAVFGYPRAELIGQPIEMLIPREHNAAHQGQRQAYFNEGGNARMMSGRVVSARHRDGHNVPVDVRLSRFEGEHGVRVIAIATDRSEQQMLAESEARWRKMANFLPQLVWTLDANGAVEFMSRQVAEYTGVEADSILGWDWARVIHPEDIAAVTELVHDAVRTGSDMAFEYRIRDRRGVYRWFVGRAGVVRDDNGKVLQWIGTSTDIDDRKQAERQVRELNATLEQRIDERTRMLDAARRDLRNILDALPSIVGYWSVDQRNRYANQAFRHWFGRDPAQMPGMGVAEVLGPAVYADLCGPIEAVLRGEPQRLERRFVLPDGRECSAVFQLLPDHLDGKVCGFYTLGHDITEVRQAQLAAEAASAAKSSFLANMSHEIRTPMNAVLGMMQLLQRTRLDRAQQDYVNKAAGAGRTLMAILNDILDFSKIEAGKLVLDQQSFAFDALMRDIGVMLATSRANKPIEIVFDIAPNVPQQLIGDPLRLQQILINLGGNALKFTERGEVVLSVRCGRMTLDHAELIFTVRDTGIGMSELQCQRVFEGFVQAEAATTRRFGGTGLGLAISQRLALLMGGELHVQSRIGQGTTFHFTVGFQRPGLLEPLGSADHRLEHLHVLLVESNATARVVMERFLRGFGWQVSACGNCNEALAQVRAQRPKAIAVDVLLMAWPQADLITSLALQHEVGAPMIAMTHHAEQVAVAEARSSEQRVAARYLVKPLTASMLFDAVAEVICGAQDLSQPKEPGAAGRLSGLRILVVEDNPTNQVVAEGLLSGEGAEVILASTGLASVDWVRLAVPPFDLVLMDIQMPDMDGFAATRLIRALPQGEKLPIVAMTANALSSDREACLAAGMDEHIGKPFELHRLVEVILRSSGRDARVLARETQTPRAEEGELALLDTAGAQARMGGDTRIYAAVAASFLSDLPQMLQGLSAPGVEPDLSERQRLVHTLKGLSGTLGAERLRAVAIRAGHMLSDKGLAVFRIRVLPELVEAVGETQRAVERVLAQIPAPQPASPASAPGPERSLVPGLAELEQLLLDSNGRALAVYAELASAHGRCDPEGFRDLGEAIDALDFAEAQRLCHQLRANLRSVRESA